MALGGPSELNGKPLLLKTPLILVARTRETKSGLRRTLSPYWAAFSMFKGTLQAPWEKEHRYVYLAVNHLPDKICPLLPSGSAVVVATGSSLIGFESCSTGRHGCLVL